MFLAVLLLGASAAFAAISAEGAVGPPPHAGVAGAAAAQPDVEPAAVTADADHGLTTGGEHSGNTLDNLAHDDGDDLAVGLGNPELDAPGLGEAVAELSVADLLGPDGVYTLRDGDGEVPLRLLDPADAAAGALPGAAVNGLEGLAALAGTAYAPAANATGTARQATPSNWLVSDSGQLFLLVGGVNVLFEPQVDEADASAILASHGVTAEQVSPLGELRGAYLLSTSSDVVSLRLADALSSVPGVASAVPNLFTPMTTEADSQSYASTTASTRSACKPYTEPWPDELSACMWHLKADTDFRYRGADPTIDINLGDVWTTTMGAGVTVAIVDRTWEAAHEDLRDNADVARSKIWGDFAGENRAATHPYHGTAVAGIVGARDNAVGGRGVAPRATLVNYNLLDAFSSANQVAAVTLNRESVAVYNLSYADPGFPGPFSWGTSWRRAVDEGTRYGFDGKGSSYVKGVGNGSTISGSNWATLDEANNHRGVVAVCAVDHRGQSASYSEEGPSLWVCAPSGGGGSGPAILAPIGQNGYSARIGGTSAAAPMVSGVVALMRSANADLTWRDVKVILANTAQKNHASSSSWMGGATKYGSNGESYSFSNHYGFGTVDAEAAVQAATGWTLLPEMLSAETTSSTVVALPSRGHEIELSLDVDPGDMDFIEHVSVALSGDIYDIRDYEWTLVSPTGAESQLAQRATECRAGTCGLEGTFHFGSSRHLGENPSGAWKLKVRKYAPDITHCVSGSDSYYRFWGIAQFCRKYRSYDQTISAVQIVVTGHSSAAVSLQPVKLTVSPATVAEGAEIDVTATIQGAAPTQDVVIPLEITAGTATAAGLPGADYATLASITVPAGASSASAKLATVGDDAAEPDETFTVGLGTLPSGYRPVTGMPKVTIADDDAPPTATLHAESSTVAEGDFVMITATLSHPSSEDVTLDVSAAAVAPAVAADGSMTPWTKLTIAAGATASSHPVAFIAAQNDVDEPLKEFEITATATGGDVADPGAIAVTIDDDAQPKTSGPQQAVTPTVKIVADGNVIEGDPATFTLVATPRPTAPLTVSVMSSLWTKYPQYQGNQGITAGARTVTIPVTGSARLTFSTTDDTDWGYDLKLTATLQTGNDYTLSSAAQTDVVVVMDDDTSGGTAVGTVSVGVSGDAIVEGEDATFTITFDRPAIKNFGSALPVRVTWSFEGNFADDSVRTATFIPGKRELTKTFSIGTLDDGNVEAGGSITFRLLPYWDLGYDLWYSVGTPGRATISIIDNDGDVPEISVAAGSDVTEGGDATFTVSRDSARPTPLTVDVMVNDSGDYADIGETGKRQVTINADETSATLTVSTTDDSTDETDGAITVLALDGSSYDLAAVHTASVTVSDDDDSSGGYTVDAQVLADVKGYAAESHQGTAHVTRWLRVLVAFGEHDGTGVTGGPMGSAEAQTYADRGWSRWDPVVVELTALEAADAPPPEPVISVTADGDVTEGAAAAFTITATPAPAADLDVTVTVAAVGDYGATTGSRTVTIPTSGAAALSVATAGDDIDEADGLVTATINTASGYTVSPTAGTATVAVSDDDVPPPGHTVDSQVIADVQGYAAESYEGTDHVARWQRVLVAFGEHDGSGITGGPMTASEAQQYADRGWTRWDPVVTELTALEAAATPPPPPPPEPVISVTAGGDVTEGAAAAFTVTASPVPTADLDVTVTVSASGDYGAATGQRTVTIPTSGSATLTVVTTDDQTDEADGSVTATVNTGSGYTVSPTAGTATATVADDDDPPPPPPPPPDPVVSIAAGGDVTEGAPAVFTVTASPAPTADLVITVTVAASGDYGATTGQQTVTVPTSGSATLRVATAGDSTDEADGSVTATLVDGTDYDLGTPATATVAVSDNDDPPPPPPPDPDPVDAVLADCGDALPTLSISSPEASRGDATVGFEVSLGCKPASSPTILLSVLREGAISGDPVIFLALAGEVPSATVSVPVDGSRELGLALSWSSGLSNRKAQGDVAFAD